MAKEIIERAKYPVVVLGLATGTAVSLGTTLTAVNIPLGLLVAGLGFVSNAVIGLAHAPKVNPVAEVTPAEKTTRLKTVKGVAQHTTGFFVDMVKSPDYKVGSSATSGGGMVLFQAVSAAGLLVTAGLPTIFLAMGIAGSAALSGFALYAIVGGADKEFNRISDFFHQRFNENAPLDPSQPNLIQKFTAKPAVQTIIGHPLVQKSLDNKVTKTVSKSASPKVRKFLLTGAAIEASLYTLGLASASLMAASGIMSSLVAFAWVASSGWGLVQSARHYDLFQRIPGYNNFMKAVNDVPGVKGAKNLVAQMTGDKDKVVTRVEDHFKHPVPSPATAPVAATSALFTNTAQPLTNSFGKNAVAPAKINIAPKAQPRQPQLRQ